MRNNLKIVTIQMFSVFMLASCSANANDVISIGFEGGASQSLSGWVHVGIKAKKDQNLDAEFEVFVGAKKGFESWWNENVADPYPNYKPFVSCRLIPQGKEDAAECKTYMPMEDFPNDEVWSVGTRPLEGDDHYEIVFHNSLLVPFSFSKVLETGSETGEIRFDTIVMDESIGEEISDKEEAELFKRVGGFGYFVSLSYEIFETGLVSFAVAV